jgi:hypothetical protein
MNFYPVGRALCSQKSNNNALFQVDFLKSGRPIFSGNQEKRRLIRQAHRAVVCCFKRAC